MTVRQDGAAMVLCSRQLPSFSLPIGECAALPLHLSDITAPFLWTRGFQH